MNFISAGLNHKTASVDLRAKVAFAPEKVPDALQALAQAFSATDAVIISTCNRTEVYIASHQASQDKLISWLASYTKVDVQELQEHAFSFENEASVRHLMEVACGLDSLVLGEPQILGQVKSAYNVSLKCDLIHSHFHRLFQQTFNIAKQVRSETTIGANPVSVAYAAVNMAKHVFSDLSDCNVLLIGAGEMIELVARHLREHNVKKMTVANRTLLRAQALALEFDAEAALLEEIPQVLVHADIVISSTASQLPILGKGIVERVLKQRRHKPIFFVDIAVPRDIEPEVGELEDAYLYTVDDLTAVIQENIRSRQDAAEEARGIIQLGVEAFVHNAKADEVKDTLMLFRQSANDIRDQVLERSIKRLNNGDSPEVVLKYLANTLTNKLIHAPSVQMKKANAQGQTDVVDWVKTLFELSDE